jgi:eukaryotic-like serine/threonine-protein kinase
MNDDVQRQPKLSLTAQRRIDRQCLAFEDAWQSGQRPSIEPYLQASPAEERPSLLRELIAVDVAYRHQLGESP